MTLKLTANERRVMVRDIWKRFFDRIFCVHYVEYKQREAHIKNELKRIGISDSGILEWRYTYKNEFEQNLAKYLRVSACSLIGPLFIETKRIIAQSLYEGYKRILVIEDDVSFLNDTNVIDSILEDMPEDANVIQFTKMTNMIPARIMKWNYLVANKKINDSYVIADGNVFWDGGCYALSRKGMEMLDKVMSKDLINSDNCFAQVDKYCIAIRNMCIQLGFVDSERRKNGSDLSLDDADFNAMGICKEDYMHGCK